MSQTERPGQSEMQELSPPTLRYILRGLVGNPPEPERLAKALGHPSVGAMLQERNATDFRQFFFGGAFPGTMTSLRLEMRAVELSYPNRHMFCSPEICSVVKQAVPVA